MQFEISVSELTGSEEKGVANQTSVQVVASHQAAQAVTVATCQQDKNVT